MTESSMLTVCCGDIRRTFRPGRDVIVGRDIRADLRIPHPAISRAHMVLRCLDGQWAAIDDTSRNGIFVGSERVASAPVTDGTAIRLGNPEGPRLTFSIEPPPEDFTLRPGTVGRTPDNDVVIADVLASSHHARLLTTPTGARIRDTHSVNGTFVNGLRVGIRVGRRVGKPVRDAPLAANDVVTIGNVDFVFTGGNLVPRNKPATTGGGLEVHDIGLTLDDGGARLLDRVSFTARPGTLTAVIGPAGSGKSTLLEVLVGALSPTDGSLTLDGRDLQAAYASLRDRIGTVPQGDVVHGGLTVAQALTFAAQLRMPPDSSKSDRHQAISRVLQELEMTPHAQTRIDELSRGRRKRVSIATELLTEPSLLVLDEPTTGLDPALDRQMMSMLRVLADAGRVIVVVTHSLTSLDECDQVLLLARGGRAAYCGPVGGVATAMGAADWADIYTAIDADPEGAQRRFLDRRGSGHGPAAHPTQAQPADVASPSIARFRRQVSTVARRQIRLILADRRSQVLVILVPIVLGLLPLAVGGHTGFGKPAPGSSAPFEPRHLIVALSFAAILLGVTRSVRDLTGERRIYRHEQAAGLSASAYLLAKIGVFGVIAVVQSALLVLVVTAPGIGKPAPSTAAALGLPIVELFADVAATAVAASILGFAISAACRSSNQYIPLLAATCVAQFVFAGSFVPITGRPALELVAALTPARWAVAAMASSIDLTSLVPVTADALWRHTTSTWLFDMAMLGLLGAVFAGFVRWRLRRRPDMWTYP